MLEPVPDDVLHERCNDSGCPVGIPSTQHLLCELCVCTFIIFSVSTDVSFLLSVSTGVYLFIVGKCAGVCFLLSVRTGFKYMPSVLVGVSESARLRFLR